jgi:molybdenum cofactor biosynthesis enzyme MoaA
MKHIALSTNGSADYDKYWYLCSRGINDFSISLDACCASTGELMSGKEGEYEKIIDNIARLSDLTYVTVGVVLTDTNVGEILGIVRLASRLGVADIRLISAAQENKPLEKLFIPEEILEKHPILRYRYNNIKQGRHVRGIRSTDNPRCPLVLDDMAVLNGHHYPCIIYMREWGKPIGQIGPEARVERKEWAEEHDCWNDPICRKNCLDVCIDYNNTHRRLQSG